MSYIKRWFEDHCHELSDKQLSDIGYSKQEIKELREAYPKPKESE